MPNWNHIADKSKRITGYLKKTLLDGDDAVAPFPGDTVERRVAGRLSDGDYLARKFNEQGRFDADAAFARLRWRVRRRTIARGVAVAASVVVLIGLFWVYQPAGDDGWVPVADHVIRPGERRAMLELPDGRKVELQAFAGARIETGGGTIRIDSVGVVCGDADTLARECMPEDYSKLSIPRGGEYSLTLSDGTRVWLNSETELRFPVRFQGTTREVYLRGEAYFDVRNNAVRPFVVNTGAGRIKVLGTAFCISIYDTTRILATLERGSISYARGAAPEVLLRPGEQLTYRAGDARPTVRVVNTRLYTAWRENLFCFEEQRLEDILDILARWYDLNVRFDSGELRDVELSGTLNRYSDVAPLLRLFELSTNVKFEIHGDTVIVKKAK